MKIYLVENTENSPGKIYAIFADYEDALDFLHAAELEDECAVFERTLWHGQPPNKGMNL